MFDLCMKTRDRYIYINDQIINKNLHKQKMKKCIEKRLIIIITFEAEMDLKGRLMERWKKTGERN